MLVHGVIHRTEKFVPILKCRICSYETKVKKMFDHHYNIHRIEAKHKNTKVQVKKDMEIRKSKPKKHFYRCKYCNFQSTMVDFCRFHIEQQHPLEFSRNQQEYIKKSQQTQIQTKGNNLNEVRIKTGDPKEHIFRCNKCFFSSKFEVVMKVHRTLH